MSSPLVPWTRPPRTFIFRAADKFHPLYDSFYIEHHYIPSPGLTWCTSTGCHGDFYMDLAKEVLRNTARKMVRRGEADPGDFVVIDNEYRHNSLLCGYVIGRDGHMLDLEDTFSSGSGEDTAPRWILPAALIPPKAPLAQWFASLLDHTSIMSPILCELPKDCALERTLFPEFAASKCIFGAVNKSYFDVEGIHLPWPEELSRDEERLVYYVCPVDDDQLSDGWDDAYLFGPNDPDDKMWASIDGEQWFAVDGRHVTADGTSASLMMRVTERTCIIKDELLQRAWHPDRALAWCF